MNLTAYLRFWDTVQLIYELGDLKSYFLMLTAGDRETYLGA